MITLNEYIKKSVTAIQDLIEKVGWFHAVLATGLFSGYSPVAPGTAGTVVAIPLYLLFVRTGWIPYVFVSLILFFVGIQGATRIEDAMQKQDPKIVVIDEIVGYLVTMFLLPQWGVFALFGFQIPKQWVLPVLGFFVFRVFDIVKPYPARKLDENPNLQGFGIMIDDVFAGIYSNIVLQVVARMIL
jgi:phosphatidylglycerophosphatase A